MMNTWRILMVTGLLSMAGGAWAEECGGAWSNIGGGVITVLACGDQAAGRVATSVGASGNSVVHVIAGNRAEQQAIRQQVAQAGLKGIVTVECLDLKALPYRDCTINSMIVLNLEAAKAAGFDLAEARRCLAPYGKLVLGRNGLIDRVEAVPVPDGMDVWTHRYYRANGTGRSQDQLLQFPLGLKWNADLAHNFDNPVRASNRYSSTRAMLCDDGRLFTFSESVFENLGPSWRSEYGTAQYLTCRDAFNGRLLWRKRIGDTFYGGLISDNLAPLAIAAHHLYLAGESEKMLKVSTLTGETVREFATAFIPGVISAEGDTVVTVTWKGGRKIGAVEQYDRRRMDWAVDTGTVEAYSVVTDKLLWKRELLGTSLLIDDGRVFIVHRKVKDDFEAQHAHQAWEPRLPWEPPSKTMVAGGSNAQDRVVVRHPANWVVALDLKTGSTLWESDGKVLGMEGKSLNFDGAASGILAVTATARWTDDRAKDNRPVLVSALTGKLLEGEALKKGKELFPVNTRINMCAPITYVRGINLCNRGGMFPGFRYAGSRAACLTGTVPAYGTAYSAQNWCNCIKGQVPGMVALASIGKELTPEEMEKPAVPVVEERYDGADDVLAGSGAWTTHRGNPARGSSSRFVARKVEEKWVALPAGGPVEGTVLRDWQANLNSRLTPAVITRDYAIVGDLDQDEVIAVRLDDGKVAWRFATASRLDASPTVYKGLCLVADHMGYVYALSLKDGRMLYSLRIAPEEKRMISCGKVESVYPVVGGVLVHEGRAYASAGRTQGSDGGLVVRAFVPETGAPIWAKCINKDSKNIFMADPKLNDLLVVDEGLIRLRDFFFDPVDGHLTVDSTGRHIQALQEAKKKELGRELKGWEPYTIANSKEVKEKEFKAWRLGFGGSEGLLCSFWWGLGPRRFGSLNFAGTMCETLAWNGEYCAGVVDRRMENTLVITRAAGKAANYKIPGQYVGTSLVLCKGGVIQGGILADAGDKHGFIRIYSLATGEVIWEKLYAAPLAFNGLAAGDDMILASFNDGSLVMLKQGLVADR